MSVPSRIVTYNGEQMPLSQAVRLAGSIVSQESARCRLVRGWSVERAVTTPTIENTAKLDPDERRARELARWRKTSAKRSARRAAERQAKAKSVFVPKPAQVGRVLRPRIGNMSKAELYEMLAEAARNTAALT